MQFLKQAPFLSLRMWDVIEGFLILEVVISKEILGKCVSPHHKIGITDKTWEGNCHLFRHLHSELTANWSFNTSNTRKCSFMLIGRKRKEYAEVVYDIRIQPLTNLVPDNTL